MNIAILEGEMQNQRPTSNRRMDLYDDLFPSPSARLGFLIKDRGTRQKDIAQVLGYSAGYISSVVTGEKDLKPENWLRLAEHFGVTLDWLLCRKGAPMYWPENHVQDRMLDFSTQTEEAIRVMEGMPPRKRDEMLSVLRAMSFAVQLADLDADKTTQLLRESLATAGIVLSAKAVEAVRSALFAFAMGLGPNDRE